MGMMITEQSSVRFLYSYSYSHSFSTSFDDEHEYDGFADLQPVLFPSIHRLQKHIFQCAALRPEIANLRAGLGGRLPKQLFGLPLRQPDPQQLVVRGDIAAGRAQAVREALR